MSVLIVRRGHCPNCSATGMVVGAAILTVIAAGTIVNAYADRFTRWLDHAPPRPAPGSGRSWVALPGAAALLAVDADDARAAESLGARVAPDGAPLEVHVSRTSRCPVRCTSCYADAGPDGADTDVGALDADLERLAGLGVFEVAIGGGDGPPDEGLVSLVRRIHARGLVPNLTTSGFGMTRAAARELAPFVGQVNVSLDGLQTYEAVRGWRGAGVALAALDALVAEGVRVGVNTVWTRANVDELEAIGRQIAPRGASEWQWLRLKPAGRGVNGYAEAALSEAQALGLWERTLAMEAETGLVIRWDCAMVPFLAAHGLPVAAAEALGIAGCPGGRSLLARDAAGRWSPCSFAAADAVPGEVERVWQSGAEIEAWRGAEARGACVSCEWQPLCRGGCRIVAGHVAGDRFAPDPECPRVRAWA